MRILDLATKDLLQIIRDWKAAFFMLIMPIVFTLVFGFAFGGSSATDRNEDVRLPLGHIDLDGSPISQGLTHLLESSTSLNIVYLDKALSVQAMEDQVRDSEVAAVLVVPPGYGKSQKNNEELIVSVILNPESIEGANVQSQIFSIINRFKHSINAAQFSNHIFNEQIEPDNEIDDTDYFNASFDLAIKGWESPPIILNTPSIRSDSNDGVASTINAFTHSSPGMMVQFALAGLIGAAEVLVLERISGSLKRLLTTNTSRVEILSGHFLAMFIIIFIQFAILIGFAQIFLHVPYFDAPLATLVVTIATTLFAASMGLLIGALAKTPDQAIMFSLIPMFIFSGLGGAWMPLEFTSSTFQKIGHFTPLAWAMDGYQNIISRGLGIESALLPSVILLGFAIIFFLLAAWRFRFE